MPNGGVAAAAAEFLASAKRVLFLALQIIVIGVAGIAVLWLARWSEVFSGLTLTSDPTIIAVLIFLVGVAILGFLWYLTRRGFELLTDPNMTPDRLAAMKDLPLGLPEGTVRAILALIVGIVGLPLLLFMDPLGIPEGTAALVANIITGVFAFYFGQRTGGGDAQATRALTSTIGTMQTNMSALEANKTQLESHNAKLEGEKSLLETVAGATLGRTIGTELDKIDRYVTLADTLATVLGPALPKGLLPAGLTDLIGKAKSVTAGVRSLAAGDLTGDTLAKLTSEASGLLGGTGLGGLLSKASGALLPMAGIGGPLAGIGLILSVGWKLESAQYRRWRARILAAPWDPSLIEPGFITRTKAVEAFPNCPIFHRAFAAQAQDEAFLLTLMNDVLADDAFARMWKQHAAAFENNEEELREGIAQFRMALLAGAAAADIDDAQIETAGEPLRDAANPDLQLTGKPTAADVARVLDGSAVQANVPEDSRAALHSLVMLVGTAKQKGIDLPKLLAEIPK